MTTPEDDNTPRILIVEDDERPGYVNPRLFG